jgi:hypothetical protein
MAGRKDGVDLDFKEDQLAIEAHVRMRSGWRDLDEISEEEYMTYAYEYTDAHPCDSDLVINKREAILYNRIYGEFLALRTFPGIPFLWEKGFFWYSVGVYVRSFGQSWGEAPTKARLLAEYFGLVEPANEN